ncbi:MAG: flagellar hook-basal body complex protein FliE [Pseudomonadota bacterium]
MFQEIDPTTANTLYRRSAEALDDAGPTDAQPFSDAMADVARSLAASLAEGERQAGTTMAGQGDMRGFVEALSQAELALETAVTVRDRVVEAYQEILRMPV